MRARSATATGRTAACANSSSPPILATRRSAAATSVPGAHFSRR